MGSASSAFQHEQEETTPMAAKDQSQDRDQPDQDPQPTLDDLNDWQLRALARELGIANNETLPEGMLREQIRQRQQA
jgi:hypothetical protein